MAVKGLSTLEREIIFSKDDECYVPGDSQASIDAGATPFYLRNIPSSVQTFISDMATSQQLDLGNGGVQTLVNRRSRKNREAFKWGIAGWDNFYRDVLGLDGNVTQEPIEFETEKTMLEGRSYDVVAESVLNKIPLALINELGEEAFNRNTLTEPQRKKFAELSSLLGGSDTSTATPVKKASKKNAGAEGRQQKATTGKTSGNTKKKAVGTTGAPDPRS